MRTLMLLAALAVGSAGLRAGETKFDVASLKPNNTGPGDGIHTLTLVPGGLRVINLPLGTILWMAHGVQQDQIVNAPDWAKTEWFDITARAPEGTPQSIDVYRPMLPELLPDRF